MNLYVGNLNYKVRESDLREVMEEYGTVDSVRIITDRETPESAEIFFAKGDRRWFFILHSPFLSGPLSDRREPV